MRSPLVRCRGQPLITGCRSAIGTLINHENRQDPPTSPQVGDTQHVPDASGGRHSARVFIGHNEAPDRLATLDEAWQFALEILALVDGLEA